MSATFTPEIRSDLVGKVEQFLRSGTPVSEVVDGLSKHLQQNLGVSDSINQTSAILNEAATKADPLPEVPAFLKNIPNWVRWRLETGDSGKPTKVPYRIDGRKAASTRPEDWTDYRTAVFGSKIDQTQGVGFVVNGGIVGFDLDGCRDPKTERLAPWAESIVDMLDSYTEVTPSQTGVRVWVRGTLPGTDKVFNLDPAVGFGAKVKIEVFTDERYFTVTGQSLFEHPGDVEERDLTEVYQLCHDTRSQHPAPNKSKSAPATTSDGKQSVPVVQTGFFGTDKLSVLMNGIVKSTQPFVIDDGRGNSVEYPSHSEADMALATVLALEYGDNPETIDAEFRKSPLYRDKWVNREDYRDETIAKAIKSAGEIQSKSQQQMVITAPAQAQAAAEIAVAANTAALAAAPATISYSEEIIPPFDSSVITGIYKKIVDFVCRGTTIPPQFAFLAAKVFIGAKMAGKVTFENLADNSCYYGAAIAETGTGKGLAWKRSIESLFNVKGILDSGVEIINSSDSGAGLKDTFLDLPDGRPLICYIDEVTSLGHKGGDKKQPEIVDAIIELANSSSISRVLAKKKNQKANRTKNDAHLSLYMCGQNGEVFMSSFAGRTKLGLYDRFYPECSEPVEAGDLPEISQGDAFRLLEEINKLQFSGRMTMTAETKQKLTDYWKSQPEKVRKKPRFKTYLTLDMYMAAFGRGQMVAEPQDLDVAMKIFERQLIIRNVHFAEEVPDKIGLYLGKLKIMTEQMRRRLNAGEPIVQVAKSLRDLQTDTRAYANNELHIFNQAWSNWKGQMAITRVQAANGHSYDKFVPVPNENETWAPPPQ
jgi:hypothetical protein